MSDIEPPGDPPGTNACCESAAVCVFAKALLARAAVCGLAARRSVGERELVECSSIVARTNCGTLAALMHERARFALRLPSPGRPMIHAQALRLHCGGLAGLQRLLGAEHADVHAMVGAAHERHGSLLALPWDAIVREITAWQPRSRRGKASP
jgi:hypothetical protein